jgi:DnaJ-class molecular chaperone
MAEDYYKTLGIERTASEDDIQKAYRRLARKYHPDMNPDDASAKQKFQDVQTAFNVLSDPKKRELYDRYGSSFEAAGAGPQPGGAWAGGGGAGGPEFDFSQFFGERFGGGGAGGFDFGDIFEQMRGGAQAPPRGGRKSRTARQRAGANLETSIEVPFATSITGGEARIAVERGAKRETITVKLPAGIKEGEKVRLRGQGEPSPDGGPAGDLFITVQVARHPFYQRQDDNLTVKLPVTIREAAEGAKVDVPTPKGTVTLTVPPGTSSGTKLRVKGHGVTPKGRPAGDLYVEVQIALPPQLDAKSLSLIEQLDALHPYSPREKLQW